MLLPRFLTLALLLLTLVVCSHSLTEGEESALQALLTNFPELGQATPPWTLNSSLACGPTPFYGVTCSTGADPHITNLKFKLAGLRGELPAGLGELLWLETLETQYGCIEGHIPPVERLRNLTHLVLINRGGCGSRVKTKLPSGLLDLRRLENLTLVLETLVDDFPKDIGLLGPSFRHLQLESVSRAQLMLQGVIPTSISELTNLEVLILPHTVLNGFEDASATYLPSLRVLDLSSCVCARHNIDGALLNAPKLESLSLPFSSVTISPHVFPTLKALTYMDLRSVPLPDLNIDDLWTLKKLEYISLALTSISGTLSTAIGDLKFLRYLDLSFTSVSGTIPEAIGETSLEQIKLTETALSLPLPDALGNLGNTLTSLDLKGISRGIGTMPNSFGRLWKLTTINLGSCNLQGSIPNSFALLSNLKDVDLSYNGLNGTIPAFSTMVLESTLNLQNNRLVGTIPLSILQNFTTIKLSHNYLGPEFPAQLESSEAVSIDISHNRFRAPLPERTSSSQLKTLLAHYNLFYGTIPTSYCGISTLRLDHNHLHGPVDFLFQCLLSNINLNNNLFSGTIPDLMHQSKLKTLQIAFNNFTGPLPPISNALSIFSCASNFFDGSNYEIWKLSIIVSNLEYLDISNNSLEISSTPFQTIIPPSLTFFSIARNRFSNSEPTPSTEVYKALRELDISHNNFTGVFHAAPFSQVTSLKIHDNHFQGAIAPSSFTNINLLDFSNNNFSFDLSAFSSGALSLLTTLAGRNNQVYGSLVLEGLPNLRTVDLSGNRLNYAPDLTSIGDAYTLYTLQALDISNNPLLPPFQSFDTPNTGLNRTALSSSSSHFPKFVTCHTLAFHDKVDRPFIFDENLFSYLQCDCAQDYFGKPPELCWFCPSDAMRCGGGSMEVAYGTFLYTFPEIGEGGGIPGVIDNPVFLNIEGCRRATYGDSNCLGSTLNGSLLQTHKDNGSLVPYLEHLLRSQCSIGSEGRLCSKCSCDSTGAGPCWYEDGVRCTKCSRVFSLSSSLPISLAALLIATAILTAVMLLVLRSKRKPRTVAYGYLPLIKRLLYRFLLLSSLGTVSILVTFLQISAEYVGIKASALTDTLSLLNGKLESFGLPCFFPFLSIPAAALLLRLALPFIIILVVAISVGLAELISKWLNHRHANRLSRGRALSEDDLHGMLLRASNPSEIAYPATALFTSVSISVIKFFYFGTALAAHQYVFSDLQSTYGEYYSRTKPWMTFKESLPLVWMSIPAILLFDFAIPILFVFICWKYRRSFNSPQVQIYFGSIFETYSPRFFWWEIVGILRKLGLVLITQALPPHIAFRIDLIITILAATHVVQVFVNAWRRKSENLLDSISALLLIIIVSSSRASYERYADISVIGYLTLSALFIVASLVTIGYQTITGRTEYERYMDSQSTTMELNTQYEDDSRTLVSGFLTEDDDGLVEVVPQNPPVSP